MDSEYTQQLKNKISLIMFNNKDFFPIVEEILLAAKHYKVKKEDIEFYVRQTIESRIGLSYIIRTKVDNIDEIRWTIPTDLIEEINIATIKSILLEYVPLFTGLDKKKFDAIFENNTKQLS